MELGIIGLPQSGKTTVFNAVARLPGQTVSPGGQRREPSIGVAKVPDPRLETLSAIFQPTRTVQAEVRYVDFPGAPGGLGRNEGIGGEYLNAVQRADALLHVVRAFQDPSVPHTEGSVEPYRDIVTMNLELAFSDLAILERRMHRLETDLKGARAQERERLLQEASLLERLKEGVEKEVPVREQGLSPPEQRLLSGYQFLTAKPMLLLFNVGEEQLAQASAIEKEMAERLNQPGMRTVAMCAKLEAELIQMQKEEEEEFRRSLGAAEPGSARMIRLSYQLMGSISYFTAGPKEVKAWTVPTNTPAVKAAGVIHSDIERGFIRAEVVSYEDLARLGSIAEARRRGLLRLEGRTYPVQDGDVITFLFNV